MSKPKEEKEKKRVLTAMGWLKRRLLSSLEAPKKVKVKKES
jgi:hypothetical protein